jgi:hypothetical protein
MIALSKTPAFPKGTVIRTCSKIMRPRRSGAAPLYSMSICPSGPISASGFVLGKTHAETNLPIFTHTGTPITVDKPRRFLASVPKRGRQV